MICCSFLCSINEYLLEDLLRTVTLKAAEPASTVKQHIDDAFQHVPEYDADSDPSYRLLLYCGDGTKRDSFETFKDSNNAVYDHFIQYVRSSLI